MSDIQHHLQIKAPAKDVYQALATVDGLANWWTSTTTGESRPGGQIDFRFGERVNSARVDKMEANKCVEMEFVSSSVDWEGTRLTFDLEPQDGQTMVKFGHRDWPESNDFFGYCSMQWAVFLLSLKQYVETGTGKPFPQHMVV